MASKAPHMETDLQGSSTVTGKLLGVEQNNFECLKYNFAAEAQKRPQFLVKY